MDNNNTTTGNNPSTLDNLPRPRIKLSGVDGNAFAIIGCVSKALRTAGWTSSQISAFQREAMSGNYEHLLATCVKYAEVR